MNIKKITDYLSRCRWCNFKEDISRGYVTSVTLDKMPYDNNNKLFVIGEATIVKPKDVLVEGDPLDAKVEQKRFFSMPLQRKASLDFDQQEDALIMDGDIYMDAAKEPDFWQSLMTLIEENDGVVKFPNGWTLERYNISHSEKIDAVIERSSKALGVEQSNTTLKVGDGELAFKLERMLEFSHDFNSELEMNEKLMRENCNVMPKSFGGLIWRRPDGTQASSGIMQEFVKNKGDMWGYLLEYLDGKLQEGYLRQRDLTPQDNPEFMQMFRLLNARTEEMSECLSRADDNPAFTPEEVNERFIVAYEKQFKVLSYETKKNILEHLDNLPEDTKVKAERLLSDWDNSVDGFVDDRINKISNAENKGYIHRVHGDFHLGQVMVTPDNDLRFIDFAGEPALTMEQRRDKYIYVRDIAGMYRSIKGYLAAEAVNRFVAKSPNADVAQERKAWAEKAIKPLIERASQTFLGKKSLNDPWLSLEVLRKNLYEVNYEVNNRPAMAFVPVNGLTDLLGANVQTAANENFKEVGKTGTER